MSDHTMGTQRVRASFNPSNDPLVAEIKAKTAELIDLCSHRLVAKDKRSAEIAQQMYEDAAMWAVKAATA
jgi:hypothetical protein